MNILRDSVFLTCFCILVADSLFAGFYDLTICDEPEKYSPCIGSLASRDSENFPLRSSQEIVVDIKKYFSGQEPTLKSFAGFFNNGHVRICGEDARNRINLAFVDVLKQERIFHVNELLDQLMMLGSNSLLSMIENELKSSTLSDAQSKSLLRAKKAIVTGINFRKNNSGGAF